MEGNAPIHDRNGTWGMGLTMGISYTIVKGLCIGEYMYAILCIAHHDPKAYEQEEKKSLYRSVSSTPVIIKHYVGN